MIRKFGNTTLDHSSPMAANAMSAQIKFAVGDESVTMEGDLPEKPGPLVDPDSSRSLVPWGPQKGVVFSIEADTAATIAFGIYICSGSVVAFASGDHFVTKMHSAIEILGAWSSGQSVSIAVRCAESLEIMSIPLRVYGQEGLARRLSDRIKIDRYTSKFFEAGCAVAVATDSHGRLAGVVSTRVKEGELEAWVKLRYGTKLADDAHSWLAHKESWQILPSTGRVLLEGSSHETSFDVALTPDRSSALIALGFPDSGAEEGLVGLWSLGDDREPVLTRWIDDGHRGVEVSDRGRARFGSDVTFGRSSRPSEYDLFVTAPRHSEAVFVAKYSAGEEDARWFRDWTSGPVSTESLIGLAVIPDPDGEAIQLSLNPASRRELRRFRSRLSGNRRAIRISARDGALVEIR